MTHGRGVGRLTTTAGGAGERGQGLVEFSTLVPVFLVLLMGMLEFGMAFNHQLTLGYATREGARIGADLVNGGGPLGCPDSSHPSLSPNAANVDQVIVEAVNRVLSSTGSPIPLNQVTRIRIFQASPTGGDTLGKDNDWVYTATQYTLPDGTKINFTPSTQSWGACNRSNVIGHTYANAVNSIGVSISYTYQMTSPLASVLRFFGGSGASTLAMSDATVMQLNPTDVTN